MAHIRYFGLSLLGGAFTATALAYAGSLFAQHNIHLSVGRDRSGVVACGTSLLEEVVVGGLAYPKGSPAPPIDRLWLDWSAARCEYRWRTERAFGWPFVCWMSIHDDPSNIDTFVNLGGVGKYSYLALIPNKATHNGASPDIEAAAQIDRAPLHVIPLRLLPLRFAIDTVLFGLALHCAALFLRACRRALRVAHNLCPACGYPAEASGSRCPECGNGLARASARQS
jgi:hypothetical protein